jgi:hypothetical protein
MVIVIANCALTHKMAMSKVRSLSTTAIEREAAAPPEDPND